MNGSGITYKIYIKQLKLFILNLELESKMNNIFIQPFYNKITNLVGKLCYATNLTHFKLLLYTFPICFHLSKTSSQLSSPVILDIAFFPHNSNIIAPRSNRLLSCPAQLNKSKMLQHSPVRYHWTTARY